MWGKTKNLLYFYGGNQNLKMNDYIILLPILFPLIGALLIVLTKNFMPVKIEMTDRINDFIIFVSTLITFVFLAGFYPYVINAGETFEISFPRLLMLGVSFKLDALSYYMVFIVAFIWSLIMLYSVDYMKMDRERNRFHFFVLLNFSGAIAFFLSGDLLTMFLFFEALTVFSYALVAHDETIKAIKAANRYIFLSLIGGLGILSALIIIYNHTGTLTFADVAYITEATPLLGFAFFISLLSFGIKAGIFPFHIWLPVAHPTAPSPASAILSGIMIKTGAFGMMRIMYNMYDINMIREVNWHIYLLIIAGITIILGSLGAVFEFDIKRRLAYSSIGQIGYIMLGMALLNYNGLLGDVFHLSAHAVMKSCLFLAAGAIIHKTGERDIRKMGGLGKMMPITMLSFTLAALAMIGLPPLTGFITKWELSLGAIRSGQPYYIILLLTSSLLNLVYYSPIIISAFFRESVNDKIKNYRDETSWRMLVPITVLALSTVIFDLVPINIPLEMAKRATELLFN